MIKEQNKLNSDRFQNNSAIPTSKNEDKNKGLASFFAEIGNIIKNLFYSESLAQTGGMHDYFGGSISSVKYCTCYYDFGLVLKIKDLSRNGQEIKTAYKPFFPPFAQTTIFGMLGQMSLEATRHGASSAKTLPAITVATRMRVLIALLISYEG